MPYPDNSISYLKNSGYWYLLWAVRNAKYFKIKSGNKYFNFWESMSMILVPIQNSLMLLSNFSQLVRPLASRSRLCTLKTNKQITLSRWGKFTLVQGVSSQSFTYILLQRGDVHIELFNKAFQSLKDKSMVWNMTITYKKLPNLPF